MTDNNTRMHGTLTAEQVCGAIYDCSAYASYDGCTLHASGIRPQAITDMLNEMLGSGDCECIWNEKEGTFHCSSCYTLLTDEISIEWPSHKVTPITLPNFCPNCGKAVKR